MSVFLRRCDVLKIACLAQIVNTISPLLTTNDQLLRQTTFYPFVLFSNHAAGQSLEPLTTAPRIGHQAVRPDAAAGCIGQLRSGQDRGAVFIVNRSQTRGGDHRYRLAGRGAAQVAAAYQLAGSDPKAVNTFAQPEHDCAEAAGWRCGSTMGA